jgi:hypothetical protein
MGGPRRLADAARRQAKATRGGSQTPRLCPLGGWSSVVAFMSANRGIARVEDALTAQDARPEVTDA